MNEQDFQTAAEFAQKALVEDGPWAKFYWGMARFWWARANGGAS